MLKLKPQIGQNIWISSDFHYNHPNIVRGITKWRDSTGNIPLDDVRNFNTLEEMNDMLVENINKTVKENDILIHDGDWSFGGIESIPEFRKKIICKNINIVLGNHDHHIEKDSEIRKLFSSVSNYLNLEIDKKHFIIFHYPIVSWDGWKKGNYHCYGHFHSNSNNRFGPGKSMDIGIDGHPEFRPYHLLDEVVNFLKEKNIENFFKNGKNERNI